MPSDEPLTLNTTASIATEIPIIHRYLYIKSLLYSISLIAENKNATVNPPMMRTDIPLLSSELAVVTPIDPCDYLKAQEFQLKRDIPDYKKTQEDDLKNMQTGLFGPKGRVHFQVASCINEELEKLDRSLSKPELFSQISALIDRRIHANYRMYPGNYIAHDYLSGTQAFAGHYTAEEKKHFTDYIDQQLARIELPNKDIPFLREKMLLMYANPLTNYLATRTDNPK